MTDQRYVEFDLTEEFERGYRVRKMVADSIADKIGDAPWHWVSFADGSLPVGSQFLGVAIVRAWNVGHAASVCHADGINPGGSVMAMPVPEHFGAPPDEWNHKLISDKAQIEVLTEKWTGDGRLTTNGEIEDQNE